MTEDDDDDELVRARLPGAIVLAEAGAMEAALKAGSSPSRNFVR